MLNYAYLISISLFVLPYLFIFLFRKDLQRKMMWSSLLAMLTMAFEFLFIPEYWHPITIFNLAPFEIEGFIFMFFAGGISSACYDLIFNKKEILEKKRNIFKYSVLTIIPLSFLVTKSLFNFNISYHFCIAILAGAIGICITRKDLYKESIFGGLIFGFIYFLMFQISLHFFPNIISFWNINNLSKIFIYGMPMEEIMLAMSFGALWSPLYSNIQNYRIVNKK